MSLCVLGVVVVLASGSARAASFEGLGILTGQTGSQPAAMSADGRTVVGTAVTRDAYSQVVSSTAWKWTAAGGMIPLGQNTGGLPLSRATGVSADGLAIVGENFSATAVQGFYLQGGTTVFPQDPTSNAGTSVTGISPDGLVILGNGYHTSSTPIGSFQQSHACVWTRQAGQWSPSYLPDVDSDNDTIIAGASPDGTYLAGRGTRDGYNVGVLWKNVGGFYQVTDLEGPAGGGMNATSAAVTPDGSVIVGGGQRCSGYSGVYWKWNPATSVYDMTQTLNLPGGTAGSSLYGVSADGLWATGYGMSAGQYVAILWDAQAQMMRNLQDVLLADGLGAALQGWSLSMASAITPDGKTIIGYGIDPSGQTEAWIATVPEPVSLGLMVLGAVALVRTRRQR